MAEHKNLVITGAMGTGKRYVACALAQQACRKGYRAVYRQAPRLFEELSLAHADGSYPRLLARLAKVDVLIIDAWGLAPPAVRERRDLLDLRLRVWQQAREVSRLAVLPCLGMSSLREKAFMKSLLPLLLLGAACASPTPANMTAQDAPIPRGPWSEVPAVEMPTGDTSIPISLLRDVADALLKLPGAKVCDWAAQRPIVGLSTEYCSTVYVAGDGDSLSWRVSEPVAGDHRRCSPYFAVKDDDYPPSQVWIVGYVHNHLCASPPSSDDLSAWPTDAFKPLVAMAEVRLWPGNPAPARYKNTAIEMASALVAERQDGTRIFLRWFPTGEVQQWSHVMTRWVTLGTCAPSGPTLIGLTLPRCREDSLQLLRE